MENFNVIILTQPDFISDEITRIKEYLSRGLFVNIRKPSALAEEVEQMILQLPAIYYGQLTLHDFYFLADKYHLGGIHLNSRNKEIPSGWTGRVSRSLHSIEEVERLRDEYDYVSLSPIFDSISKQGYKSAFSEGQIKKAKELGIINKKVYALGGVTFNRLDEVKRMGFGGAMILGDAWR